MKTAMKSSRIKQNITTGKEKVISRRDEEVWPERNKETEGALEMKRR